MSASRYRIVATLSAAELIRVQSPEYGTQLWSQGQRGVRQLHDCVVCQTSIGIGERAYRPLSNAANRGKRICLGCVDAVARKIEGLSASERGKLHDGD